MACHLVEVFILHTDMTVMRLAAHDQHHKLFFMSAGKGTHLQLCCATLNTKYQELMDLDVILVSRLQHSYDSYKHNPRSLTS